MAREDEVEAVFERGREVVADLGDVAGDDLGEVGQLLRERAYSGSSLTAGLLE